MNTLEQLKNEIEIELYNLLNESRCYHKNDNTYNTDNDLYKIVAIFNNNIESINNFKTNKIDLKEKLKEYEIEAFINTIKKFIGKNPTNTVTYLRLKYSKIYHIIYSCIAKIKRKFRFKTFNEYAIKADELVNKYRKHNRLSND